MKLFRHNARIKVIIAGMIFFVVINLITVLTSTGIQRRIAMQVLIVGAIGSVVGLVLAWREIVGKKGEGK